jgi:hypothetical protein
MKKNLNQHKVGDLWSLGLPNGIDINFLNLQGDFSNFNCALHDSLSTKLIKKRYGVFQRHTISRIILTPKFTKETH